MNPEIQALNSRISQLESIIKYFVRTSDYRFLRPIKGGTDGLRIGTQSRDKIGFFDALPVVQNTSPNGKQDKSGSGGTNITDGTGYNGNTGSFYYTVGDIVYALKQYGLLDT